MSPPALRRLPPLVLVLLAAAAAAGTASAQATVTCTPHSTRYYTVTVMQTVTKLLLRPDDPFHLGRQLQERTPGRHATLPPQGYLPPPAQGYLPPPAQGYLPPPAQGYLPPPAQGYLPPPAPGYLPPRTVTPITVTPAATTGPVGVTMENIIVVPCRCDKCSVVLQEDPCECVPQFGCGGLVEARRGVGQP